MPALPNPFTDSAADWTSPVVDTADTSNRPPVPDVSAGPFDEPSMTMEVSQEAPAAGCSEPGPAVGLLLDALAYQDSICDVHEIFYHARRLVGPTRFVLDEQKFMDAIEPPPLFLQFEKIS